MLAVRSRSLLPQPAVQLYLDGCYHGKDLAVGKVQVKGAVAAKVVVGDRCRVADVGYKALAGGVEVAT